SRFEKGRISTRMSASWCATIAAKMTAPDPRKNYCTPGRSDRVLRPSAEKADNVPLGCGPAGRRVYRVRKPHIFHEGGSMIGSLARWFRRGAVGARSGRGAGSARRFTPQLEALEDRALPATTYLMLDYTPDSHSGGLRDTFYQVKTRDGRYAPSFFDFNRD